MTNFSQLFPDNRCTGETTLRQAQLVMLRMLKIIDYICQKHQLQYWLGDGTLLGAVRHQGFIPWDDDLDICMIREDYEKFLVIAQKELPPDMFVQTREIDPDYDYLPLPCKVRDTKSRIVPEGAEKKKYRMGLFVDIFPFDRFHADEKTFAKEKRMKSFFFILCKALDAKLDNNASLFKRAVGLFEPIWHIIAKAYLRKAKKVIAENQQLGGNCIFGSGFDTPWRLYFKYDDIFPLKNYKFEDGEFLGPQNADVYLTELYGKDYMTPPPPEKRNQVHGHIIPLIGEEDQNP